MERRTYSPDPEVRRAINNCRNAMGWGVETDFLALTKLGRCTVIELLYGRGHVSHHSCNVFVHQFGLELASIEGVLHSASWPDSKKVEFILEHATTPLPPELLFQPWSIDDLERTCSKRDVLAAAETVSGHAGRFKVNGNFVQALWHGRVSACFSSAAGDHLAAIRALQGVWSVQDTISYESAIINTAKLSLRIFGRIPNSYLIPAFEVGQFIAHFGVLLMNSGALTAAQPYIRRSQELYERENLDSAKKPWFFSRYREAMMRGRLPALQGLLREAQLQLPADSERNKLEADIHVASAIALILHRRFEEADDYLLKNKDTILRGGAWARSSFPCLMGYIKYRQGIMDEAESFSRRGFEKKNQ